MKCKGSHHAGSVIHMALDPTDMTNVLNVCGSEEWELIWAKCLVEEGKPLNLYQCKICKRIVVDTEDWLNSDNWV